MMRSCWPRVLISTDLLARGIDVLHVPIDQHWPFHVRISTDIHSGSFDVQQVSLVINFDLSGEWRIAFHRLRRSRRFGGGASRSSSSRTLP